jgi:hypothetical protein
MHKKARAELDEETQKRLNKGRVQIEKEESHRRDMEKLQESSFARYKDDTGLEDLRRDVIREGDPMAAQAAKVRSALDLNVPLVGFFCSTRVLTPYCCFSTEKGQSSCC